MAALAAANPTLMLNLLGLSGQDLTGCLSNCSNQGTCGLNEANKLVCKCEEFFTGDSCETDTRACSYFPCQNGANCTEVIVPNGLNTFNCTCNSSIYYGDRCQMKVDICEGISCSFNGKCFNIMNVPVCKCFINYNGTRCELKSEALKAIESTISCMSIVAICLIGIFFVMIMAMDYFTYLHLHLITYWNKETQIF